MRKPLFFCVLLILPAVAIAAGDFQHPTRINLDHGGERWAQKTLRELSLEEKIGQMFMVRVLSQFMDLKNPVYLKLRDQISRYHPGSVLVTVPADGPLLYKSGPYEAAMLINQLQHDSRLPLLVSADFERGASMRLSGVAAFPHAMAFGAAGRPDFAEQFGRIVAQESRALGVQWNFFPVADVNSNPANPIINIRAFGEDPRQVADLVEAYIRGARQEGMLTTVKHFPGHGDTSTDSHLGLAAVNRSREQIEQIDLMPFRGAIAAGVDSIMVSHVTASALEPDAGKVATTSSSIINDLLKKELGFKGLVVTDALEMGALTRLYPQGGAAAAGRAAVDSVKAGNDVLVVPSDLDGAYRGLLSAVRSGEIAEARINESVLKILRAKASAGLNKARLVDVNAMSSTVARPESLTLAQQVADLAITLVRENGRVLPLKNSRTFPPATSYGTIEPKGSALVAVLLTDDVRMENGRQFEHELRSRVPGAQTMYIDQRIAAALVPDVRNAVKGAEKVVVGIYMTPVAGRAPAREGGDPGNSMSLAPATVTLLQSVLESAADKTVVVAFGSPYIAADFPQIENYICAYSSVPTAETAAARALFGEVPVQGHLPVTIPGFGQRGTGIQKPALLSSDR